MAAPVLQYTWPTRGNCPFPDTSTNANISKSWWWMLKAHLLDQVSTGTTVGTRIGTWTCVGSSDGTTAALDGTDRWTATFNAALLVQNSTGSNHSWIVLQSPAGLGPTYMCIDLNDSTTTSGNIVFSKVAFTGGSVTSRPTSSVEWAASFPGPPGTGTVSTFMNDLSAGASYMSNFTIQNDGMFFYATTRNTTNIFNSLLFLLRAVDTQAGDTAKEWVGFSRGSSGRGAGIWQSSLASSGGIVGRTANNVTVPNSSGAVLWQFGGSSWADNGTADSQTSDHNVLPVLLYTLDSGHSSYRGRLPDIWAMGAPIVGSSFPSTGSPVQHVVGSCLIPFSVVPTL